MFSAIRGVSAQTDSKALAVAKLEVRAAIEAAIAAGDLPGAVVGFWHNGQWLVRDIYGNRAMDKDQEVMTLDTVFDMASITKPVSILGEKGKEKRKGTGYEVRPQRGANRGLG